jgi:hypothetical protein
LFVITGKKHLMRIIAVNALVKNFAWPGAISPPPTIGSSAGGLTRRFVAITIYTVLDPGRRVPSPPPPHTFGARRASARRGRRARDRSARAVLRVGDRIGAGRARR